MPSRLDSEGFRYALGHFASGVTVVTTAHGGETHGTTVSAFSSLSLEPPLILVCLDCRSRTPGMAEGSGRFAVNILAEDGEEVARHFAARGDHKLDGVAHDSGIGGVPRLDAALAVLECRLTSTLPQGDHLILVGEVEEAHVREERTPLVYYRGGYSGLR